MSIFGNIKQESVKRLYAKTAEALKANQLYGKDETLDAKIKKLFETLLRQTIQKVTNGKFNLIIAHTSENTYSPGDISKAFDREKLKGRKIKMIFLDYVDTMTPTIQKYSGDDYDVNYSVSYQ